CLYGLARIIAACGAWQVPQGSSCGLATRCCASGAGWWMEWQVRQFTVAEFACVPAWRETRSVVRSWQRRQVSFAPSLPTGFLILVLSPPDSMCAVPSPWQVAQTSFETSLFFTAPRAWGL